MSLLLLGSGALFLLVKLSRCQQPLLLSTLLPQLHWAGAGLSAGYKCARLLTLYHSQSFALRTIFQFEGYLILATFVLKGACEGSALFSRRQRIPV